MTSPQLSVLLPFRDVEDTLEEAMRSVLAERDVALELLMIDDGSSDRSRAIASSIDDARVRVLSSGGEGIVAALEQARREARAAYLGRMDGDDVSLPGRFAAQLDRIDREPGLGVIGGQVEAFSDGVLGEGLARYVAWQNGLITPADHARDVFVEATLCHPSVVMRAASVEAVGGYRAGAFAEDWDLWLRLDGAGFGAAKVEQAVLRWRHRDGRATFSDPRYGEAAHRSLRAMHLAPRLSGMRAVGRHLTCWGAGPVARRHARALEAHGVAFERFVEIDPKRIGGVCRGAPIIAPADLTDDDFVVVLVGARGARDLIRADLLTRGRSEGHDFLCAT